VKQYIIKKLKRRNHFILTFVLIFFPPWSFISRLAIVACNNALDDNAMIKIIFELAKFLSLDF
jgi:hypothetical protein